MCPVIKRAQTCSALGRLNPKIPTTARKGSLRKLNSHQKFSAPKIPLPKKNQPQNSRAPPPVLRVVYFWGWGGVVLNLLPPSPFLVSSLRARRYYNATPADTFPAPARRDYNATCTATPPARQRRLLPLPAATTAPPQRARNATPPARLRFGLVFGGCVLAWFLWFLLVRFALVSVGCLLCYLFCCLLVASASGATFLVGATRLVGSTFLVGVFFCGFRLDFLFCLTSLRFATAFLVAGGFLRLSSKTG